MINSDIRFDSSSRHITLDWNFFWEKINEVNAVSIEQDFQHILDLDVFCGEFMRLEDWVTCIFGTGAVIATSRESTKKKKKTILFLQKYGICSLESGSR